MFGLLARRAGASGNKSWDDPRKNVTDLAEQKRIATRPERPIVAGRGPIVSIYAKRVRSVEVGPVGSGSVARLGQQAA